MLSSLYIKNLAIINELNVSFENGLNLSGLDRCEENYFRPKIETTGLFKY